MLGQISGRVYRSDTGEPVPKAQVELYPSDPETVKAAGPERIVRTGPDGTFVFPDLPAGSFGVSVWHNGFSEFSPQEDERDQPGFITLKPGQKLESLALRLHPTGVIAGQVSDEEGEAVQGLEVFALRIDFQPGGRKQVSASARTVSDDLGNFRMPNLPPGSYYVSAGGLIEHPMEAVGLKQGPTGGAQYRNTFYPGTSSLDEAQVLKVGPELATNDIRFTVPTEGNYAITGKVLSGARRLTPKDAEVSCQRVDAAGYTFRAAGQTVQMESDHSFKFSSLPPGDYTLSVKTVNAGVEKELGFASVRVVDSNLHANIEVGRAAEVRGSVQASQGLSLAGKRITLETFASGFIFFMKARASIPADDLSSPTYRPVNSSLRFQMPKGKKPLTLRRRSATAEITRPASSRWRLGPPSTAMSLWPATPAQSTVRSQTARTRRAGSSSFWSLSQGSFAGFRAIASQPTRMSPVNTKSRG